MFITFKRLGIFMAAVAFIGAPAFSAKAQSYSCGIYSEGNAQVAIGSRGTIDSNGDVKIKQGQVHYFSESGSVVYHFNFTMPEGIGNDDLKVELDPENGTTGIFFKGYTEEGQRKALAVVGYQPRRSRDSYQSVIALNDIDLSADSFQMSYIHPDSEQLILIKCRTF